MMFERLEKFQGGDQVRGNQKLPEATIANSIRRETSRDILAIQGQRADNNAVRFFPQKHRSRVSGK